VQQRSQATVMLEWRLSVLGDGVLFVSYYARRSGQNETNYNGLQKSESETTSAQVIVLSAVQVSTGQMLLESNVEHII